MLGDGAEADLDEAERWVDDWQTGIEERAAKARELSQRLAGLSATAHSEDGLVEVTVDSSGALVGLALDDGIRGQSAARTSEQVLSLVRTAQASLAGQAAAVATEVAGPDDPTGRAIVASYAGRFGWSEEDDRDAGR